jgi:hypothetical protein
VFSAATPLVILLAAKRRLNPGDFLHNKAAMVDFSDAKACSG